MKSSGNRLLIWFSTTIVALAVLLQAAGFLWSASTRFLAPHENNYPESLMVWQAREWSQGRQPYQPWDEPPYAEALYGPLAYAPTALLVHALEADVTRTYRIGRMFSVVSTFGILLTMCLWLGAKRTGWVPIAVVVSLYLSQRLILDFAVGFRPDHQAAFLSLAGLACFCLPKEGGRFVLRVAGLFLLAAGVYTKPDFVAAPIALGLWGLATGHRGVVLCWVPSLIALGLVVFGLLQWWTGGLYASNTLALTMNHGWDAGQWRMVLGRDLPASLIVLILLAVSLARRGGRRDLAVWYFWVALVVHVPAIAKTGGNINYLLEPLNAAMLLVGRLLAVMWRGRAVRRGGSTSRAARWLLAVLVPVAFVLTLHAWSYLDSLPIDFDRAQEAMGAVEMAVSVPRDAPTLIDDGSLAIRIGRPVLLDHYHWKLLMRRGMVSDQALVGALEGGEIACVIYRPRVPRALDPDDLAGVFSPAIARAVTTHYRPMRSVGPYLIAVPNGQEARTEN